MPDLHTPQRRSFRNGGLTLSYLDVGGQGAALIALHAHWMEATTFGPLAETLAPAWRVIALDQRGHGYSDHAPRDGGYTRDAYLSDLAALYAHLGLESAVLLGNSLGGVNAYQFAARHPGRVRALIIEDIGAVSTADTSFALDWVGTFPTRAALEARIGPRLLRSLAPSIRETAHGWRLAFDPEDAAASIVASRGDHWADWLASECPALLVRGRESRVTTQEQLEEMAARRPNTRLVTLEGGHTVHVDDPAAFADLVVDFLRDLENPAI